MDELKQINLTESNIKQENTLMEDTVMEPVKKSRLIPIMVIIGILLGLGTGFYIAQKQLLLAGGGSSPTTLSQNPTSASDIKVDDVFGSADEKTFPDSAEGILQPGGIDGEGSHHIERGANKSQWVYVTSSVVDLDMFVSDRVMVWGQTNTGKKAGWLMDIGKLKVLELKAAEINNIEPS
ncbi:MAG: hypothetical protein ABII21_01275 [bacterium]